MRNAVMQATNPNKTNMLKLNSVPINSLQFGHTIKFLRCP